MNKRLKELRKSLGLKQRELANKLGVTTSNVGMWESGSRAIPRSWIYQICHEFNVRREWLERGEGEMFETENEKKPEPVKDARTVQVEFCAKMFDLLPRDMQKELIKALRERLGVDV